MVAGTPQRTRLAKDLDPHRRRRNDSFTALTDPPAGEVSPPPTASATYRPTPRDKSHHVGAPLEANIAPWLESASLEPAIEIALNVNGNLHRELPTITREEVFERLGAAELRGLAPTVWESIYALQQHELQRRHLLQMTPSPGLALPCERLVIADSVPLAATPSPRARFGSEPEERLVGWGADWWQYDEADTKWQNFVKAFKLTMYNIAAIASATKRAIA